MTIPNAVRGTQSLLGEDADRLAAVVSAFDRVRTLFGYQRVEVPVFESTDVFARSLGETSDVVSKEMYTFRDKGDRSLTLRPEFTAGIARAFISEGWLRHVPLRVATQGPVFRYENPQAGRYRQFNQIDAEILGIADPSADIELLVFADQLFAELDIESEVTLRLNTLGDTESRDRWRKALIAHFEAHRNALSEESLQRLDRNPLRILDSKDPRDKRAVEDAPKMVLSSKAKEFFDEVINGLKSADVDFELDTHLVRGLDYYRHTTFEYVTEHLGSQNAVLAGGRYDGLVEALGGPSTPAVGWAGGVERLAQLIPHDAKRMRTAALVIESDEPALQNIGRFLLGALRRGGMPTQIVADGSLRKRFNKAISLQPDYLLVLLPSEEPNVRGILRVKRRIIDRYKTRGTIYKSLKPVLQKQFGVDPSAYRRITRRGGEVALLRKQ